MMIGDIETELYVPKEWTPCPSGCAYCNDPFYGHLRPHDTQKRIVPERIMGQTLKVNTEREE